MNTKYRMTPDNAMIRVPPWRSVIVGWLALALVVGSMILFAPSGAEGQVVDRPLILCGVSHEPPNVESGRAIDYQMVEAPAGSTVRIGVLFLYTGQFTALQAGWRVESWIRTANDLFGSGSSGVRVESVGVLPAPPAVSRAAVDEDKFESVRDFDGVLKESLRSHRQLLSVRNERGADVVIVMAPSPSLVAAGTAAAVWTQEIIPAEMRKLSYAVVGASPSPSWAGASLEGRALAHEIGHLLGLHHDVTALGPWADEWRDRLHDPAAFGFLSDESTGVDWWGREAVAGTVMAYADMAIAGFSRPSGSLPVLAGETFSGLGERRFDAGDKATNADRALRTTAPTVASFYTAITDEPPTTSPESRCVLGGESTDSCHTTAAGHSFAVRHFHEGGWKWANIGVRSGDSAVFHFFGPDNLEVFAKVLDGCAIDGTVWVYASGLTDLPIDLRVLRSGTGELAQFPIPDGGVLRPRNGGRLNWCER